MSYDLSLKVITKSGFYVEVLDLGNITYNLGRMLRALNLEPKDEPTPLSNMNFHQAVIKIETNREDYIQYEPENKWGTVSSLNDTLKDIINRINAYLENEPELLKNDLYVTWY